MSLVVRGEAELVAGLSRVSSELAGDGLDTARREAGEAIRADARGRAPKRTGRLAGSLVARDGVVGTPLSYGLPVHFGVPSRNQRPQPFLADAVRAQQSAVLTAYTRGVDNLLKAV